MFVRIKNRQRIEEWNTDIESLAIVGRDEIRASYDCVTSLNMTKLSQRR